MIKSITVLPYVVADFVVSVQIFRSHWSLAFLQNSHVCISLMTSRNLSVGLLVVLAHELIELSIKVLILNSVKYSWNKVLNKRLCKSKQNPWSLHFLCYRCRLSFAKFAENQVLMLKKTSFSLSSFNLASVHEQLYTCLRTKLGLDGNFWPQNLI